MMFGGGLWGFTCWLAGTREFSSRSVNLLCSDGKVITSLFSVTHHSMLVLPTPHVSAAYTPISATYTQCPVLPTSHVGATYTPISTMSTPHVGATYTPISAIYATPHVGATYTPICTIYTLCPHPMLVLPTHPSVLSTPLVEGVLLPMC